MSEIPNFEANSTVLERWKNVPRQKFDWACAQSQEGPFLKIAGQLANGMEQRGVASFANQVRGGSLEVLDIMLNSKTTSADIEPVFQFMLMLQAPAHDEFMEEKSLTGQSLRVLSNITSMWLALALDMPVPPKE